MQNQEFVKSNLKQVKYLKMCKKFNFHAESCNEEDEIDDEEEEEEKIQSIKTTIRKEDTASKNYCLIQ